MTELNTATFIQSCPGIMIIRFKPGAPAAGDLKAFEETFFNILRNTSERLVILADGSRADFLSSEVRVFIARAFMENKTLYTEKVLATGFITGSARSQAVLMAVGLLVKRDIRFNVFADHHEAITWAANLNITRSAA
jgi:hypothetical protein